MRVNTQERLTADYWVDGWYSPDALHACNVLLRDRRTDEVDGDGPEPPGPGLLLHRQTGSRGAGGDHLRATVRRGPTPGSRRRAEAWPPTAYHVRGQAIDLAVPGFNLSGLRQTAQSMEMGGVGYYPRAGFSARGYRSRPNLVSRPRAGPAARPGSGRRGCPGLPVKRGGAVPDVDGRRRSAPWPGRPVRATYPSSSPPKSPSVSR